MVENEERLQDRKRTAVKERARNSRFYIAAHPILPVSHMARFHHSAFLVAFLRL